MALLAAENCGPITGSSVRRFTVYLIKVLKTFHNMLSHGTPELVHLNEPTGPINKDKKVDFFAIAEDFLSQFSADPVHWLEVHDRYSQTRDPCL